MIPHNGTHLLVKVPDYKFEVMLDIQPEEDWYKIDFIRTPASNEDSIGYTLPPATYGQPFLASEAGEVEAKGVVENRPHLFLSKTVYKDYSISNPVTWIFDPTASLHSLCRSLGWEPEKTIVVPILK